MDTTPPWRLTLLGALHVEQGGSIVTRFRSQKAGGLLAYLALFPRRVHAREELADLFWPDADPEAGRTNLRSVLASLRRQLEPPGVEAGSVLVTRGHSDVSLNRAAFETDAALFERALAGASAAQAAEERSRFLSEAVNLYGGPLLPGRYEDWVLTERDRLAGLHLGALRGLARLYEQSGDWERALDFARRAVSADSLSEEAHLDILRLLMASGQASAAKRHYAEMARLFDEELGAEPPKEARALLAAAPATPVLIAPLQTLSSRLPIVASPPVSLVASPVHLPLTLTRFFGRVTEGAQIAAALRGPERARLLTLTGAGGSGKTRLAIETARALAPDFLGGVWFVALAELRDAGRFFETLAAVLRLPQTPTVSPRDQVLEALRQAQGGEPVLLVLDNFEQIVKEGAVFVADLLTVPAVSCLVTSRQRLLLDGEHEFALPPLATPDFVDSPERLLEFSSVQLFVSRAQSARPDFQITAHNAAAVAQLCRHLEGIPLALELAAAWAQTLSPSQMLERLARRFELLVARRKDVPGRHATLRATVEWSYQLLSDELKRFFAGLSVFQGGWTLKAAEDILGEPCALEFLAELQDRSLIIRDEDGNDPDAPPRFRMLETLREFAAEQIVDAERRRLAQRHFDWCLRFAEEAERHQRGADQARHLRQLEREQGNMRAALEYTLRSGDEERRRDGLRLAASLGWFWFRRDLHREGREWLTTALSVDAYPEARIRALHSLAVIINFLADYHGAFACFQQAMTLAESIEHEEFAVYSLFGTGLIRVNIDKPGEDTASAAAKILAAAAQKFSRLGETTGDRWQAAHSWYAGALGAVFAGDLPVARAGALEAIAAFREIEDVWMITSSYTVQGIVGYFGGDTDLAESGFTGAMRSSEASYYQTSLFWGLFGLATVAARRGQAERAARLFGAAERHAEAIHLTLPQACRPLRDRDVALTRDALGDPARFEAAWAEGRALPLNQAVALALS